MRYKLISFYSEPEKGNYYTEAGRRMSESCARLGIDYKISKRESKGEWVENTKMKPVHILEEWHESDVPILWVDVDCPIYKKPSLAGYEQVDFAGVRFKGASKLDPPLKIMGTTLFFNKTEAARLLLNAWAEACALAENKDYGDHRLLSNLLYRPNWFKYSYLPNEFCTMHPEEDSVISLGLARPVKSREKAMSWLRSRSRPQG